MARGVLSEVSRLRQKVTLHEKTIARLKQSAQVHAHEIERLTEENKALRTQLENKELQRKNLQQYLFKGQKQKQEKQAHGKKQGSRGFHRPVPDPSTIILKTTFTPVKCPCCGEGVGKAVDTVIKYQEDIDLKPKPQTIEYTITRHWCGRCEEFVRSSGIPAISRIGPRVMGYILYARFKLRLTHGLIQRSLFDLYGFTISDGEISDQLSRAQELFKDQYNALTILIQESDAVYADETGWRINGKNWYIWVFVTKDGLMFRIADTRGAGVAREILKDKPDRVLIHDGYTGYDKLPGDHQNCWVHTLRAARTFSEPLLFKLQPVYTQLLFELTKPLLERDSAPFIRAVEALIADDTYDDIGSMRVRQRLKKELPCLFTCLKYEGVLPENNTAERAIRPQVVMRKIFGGSRSYDGASAHMTATSVIATLEKTHPDKRFFELVLPLIEKKRAQGGE